jgi:RHS repeat-associated protein
LDKQAYLPRNAEGWHLQPDINVPVFLPIIEVTEGSGTGGATVTVAGKYQSLAGKMLSPIGEGEPEFDANRFRIFAPPGVVRNSSAGDTGTLEPLTVSGTSSRCLYKGYRFESPLAGMVDPLNNERVSRQPGANFGGLYYTLHRHYDPVFMRFTSPDPLAAPFYNLYHYAGNSPTAYYDPDGLAAIPLVVAAGIVVLAILATSEPAFAPSEDFTEADYQAGRDRVNEANIQTLKHGIPLVVGGGVGMGVRAGTLWMGGSRLFGGFTGVTAGSASWSISDQLIFDGTVDPARVAGDTLIGIGTAGVVAGGAATVRALREPVSRGLRQAWGTLAPRLNPANYSYSPALSMNGLGGIPRYVGPKGVLFGQASVKNTFAHGPFAGRTVGDVASGLRSGTISPDQLPVEFIVRNGQRVALNNRSLLALRRAGMEPTRLIDRTGSPQFENLLNRHLRGASPSEFIRVRGGPRGTSLIE